MSKNDRNKEIPTITSLLNRKKLESKAAQKKRQEALDQSQPIDLTALEKEFAEAEVMNEEPSHPAIEGIDLWDTRGIARTIKHNTAARKTEKFKTLLAPEPADPEKTHKSYRVTKRKEETQSSRAKRPPPPPPQAPPQPPSGGRREVELRAYSKSKPDIERIERHTDSAPAVKPRAPAPPQQQRPSAPPLKHPSAPTAPSSPTAPVVQVATSRQGLAPSTVQPASGRAKRESARPPTTWTMEMLRGGPDPLGKGLAILLERGALSALFLAITPPPPGAKIPHFAAAAAAKPTSEKLQLWTGLRWDPATVPQVWNTILKSGYIEFHPPGNVTNVGSRRNTIRGAFGLGSEEILLLIRVGPVAACRGVLAIYSDRSLLMELGPILTLFNTPLPLQKAG